MGIFEHFPYTNFHELNADWLLKNYHLLVTALEDIKDWISTHEQEYNELKRLYDQLERGELPEATYEQLKIWINNNMVSIIGTAIKMVAFDLTPDGYLRATIPDSWSELIFGTTGLDTFPAGVDFGHLTINY